MRAGSILIQIQRSFLFFFAKKSFHQAWTQVSSTLRPQISLVSLVRGMKREPLVPLSFYLGAEGQGCLGILHLSGQFKVLASVNVTMHMQER